MRIEWNVWEKMLWARSDKFFIFKSKIRAMRSLLFDELSVLFTLFVSICHSLQS